MLSSIIIEYYYTTIIYYLLFLLNIPTNFLSTNWDSVSQKGFGNPWWIMSESQGVRELAQCVNQCIYT